MSRLQPRQWGCRVHPQNHTVESPTNTKPMCSHSAESLWLPGSQLSWYPTVTLNKWPPLLFRENTQAPQKRQTCARYSLYKPAQILPVISKQMLPGSKSHALLLPWEPCSMNPLSILHLPSLLSLSRQPVNIFKYTTCQKSNGLWSPSTFNSVILATISLCDSVTFSSRLSLVGFSFCI